MYDEISPTTRIGVLRFFASTDYFYSWGAVMWIWRPPSSGSMSCCCMKEEPGATCAFMWKVMAGCCGTLMVHKQYGWLCEQRTGVLCMCFFYLYAFFMFFSPLQSQSDGREVNIPDACEVTLPSNARAPTHANFSYFRKQWDAVSLASALRSTPALAATGGDIRPNWHLWDSRGLLGDVEHSGPNQDEHTRWQER